MSRFFASRGDSSVLYALMNGQNGDSHYHLGALTYENGAWSEPVSNPFLSPGLTDETHSVVQPAVFWSGSEFVVIYVGYDGTNRRLRRLTFPAWPPTSGSITKQGTVLGLGSGGDADETQLLQPSVLYEPSDTGHELKLWYTGVSSGGTYTVCYAESSDLGLTWTRYGTIIGLGAGGAWDAAAVVSGATINVGGTYYHLFSGRKNTSAPYHWGGGYASATNPRSTWTKGGGNPTLQAEYVTSGMSQSLTSNAASGQAVVHVGTTSHWVVGMPMLIADGDSVTEQHNIASIDSGTQVTLDSNLVSTFSTAQGAVLRPFAFNSAGPVSVRSVPSGGYELYCNVFQGVDDLSVAGNTLWEGAMVATAAAITGAWTLSEASGLLVDVAPVNGGWDKYSAGDNTSVIAAP